MSSVPPHVNSDLVVAFDYFAQPGMKNDPHKLFAELFHQRSPRIVWTTLNGGHWIIGGYDELFEAARNTDVFSSSSMQIPAMADEPKLFPLNADPPQHAAYRKVLNPSFTAARVLKMEQKIRVLCDELISRVVDQREAEFVHDVAEPLPITILMDIAGVPKSMSRAFRDNVVTFLTTPARRTETLIFFRRELGQLMAQKRSDPQDDLISQIVVSTIDDRPISEDELMGFVLLLMVAGLDTVTNAMSLGMHHLATDQTLQDTLRSDPKLIPLAVEELLRRYAFALMGRIITQDSEFRGISMKAGDRVLFAPPGAGVDPATYPNPAKVDISRQNKGIPSFGFGPHRCVGMHLARLELRIMYEQWLKRIPSFSLTPGHVPTFSGGVVIGLEALALRW